MKNNKKKKMSSSIAINFIELNQQIGKRFRNLILVFVLMLNPYAFATENVAPFIKKSILEIKELTQNWVARYNILGITLVTFKENIQIIDGDYVFTSLDSYDMEILLGTFASNGNSSKPELLIKYLKFKSCDMKN